MKILTFFWFYSNVKIQILALYQKKIKIFAITSVENFTSIKIHFSLFISFHRVSSTTSTLQLIFIVNVDIGRAFYHSNVFFLFNRGSFFLFWCYLFYFFFVNISEKIYWNFYILLLRIIRKNFLREYCCIITCTS